MNAQALLRPGALPRHGADAFDADTPASLARERAYHTLDALRGVAALCVLLFHAGFFLRFPSPAEGYLAVDLFFVMSGFIIAHRYDGDLARGMGVRRFLRVRLVRLYPLFALGTLLGAVPALTAVLGGRADHLHEGLVASLPLAIAMLPSRLAMPDLTIAYPLNYVSWSLMLEILVNLAYAASFRFWTRGRLAWFVAVSIVGVALAAWRFGSLNVGWDWANAIGGLPRILFGFALGVLLQRRHAARPLTTLSFLRVPWWTLVAAVPILLFLDPAALGLTAWRPAWDIALATLVVPAIVAAAIANEPPRAARNACATAGAFSYVLYSLHAPFVGLFLRGEDRLHIDVQTMSPLRAVVFAGLLAALCLVAHAAWYRPVRRRLSRPSKRVRSLQNDSARRDVGDMTIGDQDKVAQGRRHSLA